MVEIHYFGHSFFKIRFPQRSVLIDPFIDSIPKDCSFDRLTKCSVAAKDLRDIALILVTHEHFDHFDKAAIEDIIGRENCCIIAHDHILQELNVQKRFKFPIKMNEETTIRNIKIKATPAHHPNAFYPLGFLLTYENQSVFHAGDTDLVNNFNEIKPDIALLPIGGTYTMDCVDAVRAVKTMKPSYAIPMHFNTFSMIQQDPKEFKQRIEKSVLKTKAVLLNPGQKIKIKL